MNPSPSTTPPASAMNPGCSHRQLQPPKDNGPRVPETSPPPYTPPTPHVRHLAPALYSLTPVRSIQLTEYEQRLLHHHAAPAIQQIAQLRRATADQAFHRQVTVMPSAPTVDVEEDVQGQDQEDDSLSSSLKIRINTSINISKNNNVVCITDSPQQHANSIARAVTKAIQENSSGNCGIPMIDCEGNPRPITIEVDAGTVVDGEGNMVGSEAFILKMMRQRDMTSQKHPGDDGKNGSSRRRQRVTEDEEEEDGKDENAAQYEPFAKRRRSS
jgi:hypothetical protein